MNLQRTFINNLKKFRKIKGISQMKLAESCDTSTSYIGEIEIGNKFPSIIMIEKIAEALQIHPYLLFFDAQVADKDMESALKPLIPASIKDEILQDMTAAMHKVLKKY
jgi:transcriptional regulator with XRE-family HTH domain